MCVCVYCRPHNAIGPFGHVIKIKMATSQNGGDSDSQKAAKRQKTAADGAGSDGDPAAERTVSGFEVGRILRDSVREKNIFVHGKVRSENSRKSLS